MSTIKPLTSRPLDLLYAVFLALHLGPAVLLDSQALFPASWFPAGLRAFLANYIATSGDPLISNIQRPEFAWLKAYIACEVFLQNIVFLLGPLALYRDSRTFWPVLLLYASHASTTTLGALANLLAAKHLTSQQLIMLLSAYVPYLLVPLIMAVDMTLRLTRLVKQSDATIKGKVQ